YWVDPLDALITPMLTEYRDKKFRNVDDAELELPEAAGEEAEEEAAPEPALSEPEFNRFVGRCVTTLGDRVTEVRESKVLRDSPVRLVSPKDAANRDMQRLYRFLDQEYKVPKKILEINRNHPLIVKLARLVTDRPDSRLIGLGIEQLYDSALVQEGLHPNPADMLPRVQELLTLAAEAATEDIEKS
ncbi:MAG TPA: molecular chaperone HtpG, partial [Anaerolineae bacterium]